MCCLSIVVKKTSCNIKHASCNIGVIYNDNCFSLSSSFKLFSSSRSIARSGCIPAEVVSMIQWPLADHLCANRAKLHIRIKLKLNKALFIKTIFGSEIVNYLLFYYSQLWLVVAMDEENGREIYILCHIFFKKILL